MSTRTLSVRVLGSEDRMSTPACGAALCDLVKYVLYQKLQVPYSYDLLRRAVCGRRDSPNARESLQASRYFRTISLAYDSLETIFKALLEEMASEQPPAEVCLVLGATLVSCREAYRLQLPIRRHKASCAMDHSAAGHRLSLALLKALTTSEIFEEMIMKPLPPTNLHILIKKMSDNRSGAAPSADPQNFTPSRGCRIPRNAKVAIIKLVNTASSRSSCCSDFKIFEDIGDCGQALRPSDAMDECSDEDAGVIESTEKEVWFQSSVVVKGFKDCWINGSSIADQWLHS